MNDIVVNKCACVHQNTEKWKTKQNALENIFDCLQIEFFLILNTSNGAMRLSLHSNVMIPFFLVPLKWNILISKTNENAKRRREFETISIKVLKDFFLFLGLCERVEKSNAKIKTEKQKQKKNDKKAAIAADS